MKANIQPHIHRYIICHYALFSLQHDIDTVNGSSLKHKEIVLALYEKLYNRTHAHLLAEQQFLYREGIKLVSTKKTDDFISEIRFSTKGNDIVLNYANYALRNKVNEYLNVISETN